MADLEALAALAIDCGLKLHRKLGPGLLESAYEALMAASLSRAGASVERQVPVPISVDGLTIKGGFRADLLVEGALLIEIKSVERLSPAHVKQLLTYLRLSKRPLGLLMNFGGATFKEGLKRVVNDHVDASPALRINSRRPAPERERGVPPKW